ncbi:MAG: TetR family transcriptional regulator [Actinomycetes bacterium]
MSAIELSTTLLTASAPIRNEPVQARSSARLAALLDSAAAVIDEIGYERLTTAMVADRAGASIGTVYRYFPDRIAVLQSLAARNSERLLARLAGELAAEGHATATDALLGVLDVTVELFRSEPGYRSLRVGDVLDLLPPSSDETANGVVAGAVADALEQRYSLSLDGSGRLAIATAVEVIDALVARAFARDGEGDAALLDEARRVVRATVAGVL